MTAWQRTLGLRPVGAVMLAVLFAGCATQRVDWNSRIGKYTYDQAVIDYGPPDKSAKLSDGSIVAEWLTCPGYAGQSFGGLGYGYPYYYGPFYPTYMSTYSPNYYLRLIFGPDGKLREWKKYSK